jgi:hypothetical protein
LANDNILGFIKILKQIVDNKIDANLGLEMKVNMQLKTEEEKYS